MLWLGHTDRCVNENEMKPEKLPDKLCDYRATRVSAPVKLALEMKTGILNVRMRIAGPAPVARHQKRVPFCANIEQRGARI